MKSKVRFLTISAITICLLLLFGTGVALAYTIVVDGNPADWGGTVLRVATDSQETDIPNDVNIKEVYWATSSDMMYWRFDTFENTKWREGMTYLWGYICMDTDYSTSTGATVDQCNGQSGFDYIIEFQKRSGYPKLWHCAPDCEEVSNPSVQFATQNTVTEIGASLADMGNLGASPCQQGKKIRSAVYFDNTTDPPDDHVPNSNTFEVTINCPTAVSVSSFTAHQADAPQNDLLVPGLAAVGVVLGAAGGMLGFVRSRRAA